jgi:TonB family protein
MLFMRGALILCITACVATSPVLAERVAPEDVLYKVGPRYPSKFRQARIGGTGRFRMNVDFNTGKVKSVTIVKSTGEDGLDREAIFALRRWRFKPGKARQVEVPITFYNGKEPLVWPRGAVLTPSR